MNRHKFEWSQRIRDDGHDLSPSELLVLLAFFLYADADGIGWPSVRTLSAVCGLGWRQVTRLLVSLEEKGYLEIVEAGGGRRAAVRRLAMPTPVTRDTPVTDDRTTPVMDDSGPLSPVTAEEVSEVVIASDHPAAARRRRRGRDLPKALAALLDGLDLDQAGTARMQACWRRNPAAVGHAVARAWECNERGNVDSVGGLAITLAEAECAA